MRKGLISWTRNVARQYALIFNKRGRFCQVIFLTAEIEFQSMTRLLQTDIFYWLQDEHTSNEWHINAFKVEWRSQDKYCQWQFFTLWLAFFGFLDLEWNDLKAKMPLWNITDHLAAENKRWKLRIWYNCLNTFLKTFCKSSWTLVNRYLCKDFSF